MCTLPPSPMAPCLPAAVAASSTACPTVVGPLNCPDRHSLRPHGVARTCCRKRRRFQLQKAHPGRVAHAPKNLQKSPRSQLGTFLPIRGGTAAAKMVIDNEDDAGAVDTTHFSARRERTVGASCGPEAHRFVSGPAPAPFSPKSLDSWRRGAQDGWSTREVGGDAHHDADGVYGDPGAVG